MEKLRTIFMGTPDFAVPILDVLNRETDVILVVSQPDACVGRKKELKSTPIKEFALAHGLEVYQPTKVKLEFEKIVELKPDLIVTCAYGQIIPKDILDCARLGCINVHASLLPKYRGGAPIHHAIINGEKETGITIMFMDEKMDTGDIILQRSCPIGSAMNVEELHEVLSSLGAEALHDALPLLVSGNYERVRQNNEEATYAWNIKREDEHLDFNTEAINVYNKVRGLYSWPKAYMILDGMEVKVLECFIGDKNSKFSPGTVAEITKDSIGICTKDKMIYITRVKPFSKKEMSALDFINGLDKERVINSLVS